MRELGEGIPRMFAEMELEGFYPPAFDDIRGVSFQVTLRNQPVYDYMTLNWLERFRHMDLSGNQKRLSAYAHAHGDTFSSRAYQKLIGLDIYAASASIKELIRKGIVRSTRKGSRIYEIIEPHEAFEVLPKELERVLSRVEQTQVITNQQVRSALGVNRLKADPYLRRGVDEGWLRPIGKGRGRQYEPASRLDV